LGYKILNVYNTAGWYFPIVPEMEKLGHTVDFAMNDNDQLGFTKYYKPNNRITMTGDITTVRKELFEISNEYDIIHISSAMGHLTALRMKHPAKPMVMQFHGWEARGQQRDAILTSRIADAVMITTTDLKKHLPGIKAQYIPHPVDTELFKPRPLGKGAVCMYHPKLEKPAREFLKDVPDVDFQVLYQVQYKDVPQLLENYDTYYDIKFDSDGNLVHDPEGDTMSRMAEEALSMGLTVIDGSFREHKGLPDKYRPENVAKQVDALYTEMMNNING
jgi:glycosyltransferase involved in cell wall biosynthesis